MPNTAKGLVQLASFTVANSTTASVVLGSGGTIPQTYTHLVLRTSDASTRGGINDSYFVYPNGSTSNQTQSFRYYSAGQGSTLQVSSGGVNNSQLNPASDASGAFASNELYICNYSSSSLTKTIMGFAATEGLNINTYLAQNAVRWDSTAAITSLTLTVDVGPYFAPGSTFYLYGMQIY